MFPCFLYLSTSLPVLCKRAESWGPHPPNKKKHMVVIQWLRRWDGKYQPGCLAKPRHHQDDGYIFLGKFGGIPINRITWLCDAGLKLKSWPWRESTCAHWITQLLNLWVYSNQSNKYILGPFSDPTIRRAQGVRYLRPLVVEGMKIQQISNTHLVDFIDELKCPPVFPGFGMIWK